MIRVFAVFQGCAALTLQSVQKSQVKAFGDNEWEGWVGGGSSQWAESRWRKTEQRSQRSAGGDSISVGRPPETCTERMWNDSTSPISLGCQGCYREVGASDQAIHAFKHSPTGILHQQSG